MLCVVAHPDDETIGCGGTLARHVAEGDSVEVICFSGGVGSRDLDQTQSEFWLESVSRKEAARSAMAKLGIENSNMVILDYRDNQFDSYSMLTLVKHLEQLLEGKSYDVVYTHFPHDLNIDHGCVSRAVQTAFRPGGCARAEVIAFCEVASSTGWLFDNSLAFNPNYFVDITGYSSTKYEALECYSSEMRVSPHARSISKIMARASARGGEIDVDFAEAFLLSRIFRYASRGDSL